MSDAGPAAASTDPVTWVIGSGGLLGTALTAELKRRGTTTVQTHQVAWATGAAGPDLTRGIDRFAERVGDTRVPWRVAWCAGAGVTGTSAAELGAEVAILRAFLSELADRSAQLGPGTVFLASSAGGLYAGSRGGPYCETDSPTPISSYGWAKLEAESALRTYAERTGHLVQFGRIANLYGPGQSRTKSQGLISAICRAGITRQPVSIYVSLDTIRDYLFVGDCAAMIADMLDLQHPPGHPSSDPIVKILASQQGTTIAALLAVCRQVFKRPPLVILGSSANARFQVRDLRFRSTLWPQIDARALTTLPTGVAATAAGLLRETQRPSC